MMQHICCTFGYNCLTDPSKHQMMFWSQMCKPMRYHLLLMLQLKLVWVWLYSSPKVVWPKLMRSCSKLTPCMSLSMLLHSKALNLTRQSSSGTQHCSRGWGSSCSLMSLRCHCGKNQSQTVTLQSTQVGRWTMHWRPSVLDSWQSLFQGWTASLALTVASWASRSVAVQQQGKESLRLSATRRVA